MGSVDNKGLTSQTLGGMSWTTLGYIVQYILQILVLAVLARLISAAEFGVVGAALIIIGFSSIFSQLGIGPAIIQRVNLKLIHIQVGYTLSLISGLILFLLLMLIAPFISGLFKMDALTEVVKALSLVFLIKGTSIVAESLLQRELKFKIITFISLASYIVGYAIAGIVLAYNGYGLWALVWANLIQSLINTLLSIYFCQHSYKLKLDIKAMKELFDFGGGFTLGKIANYFALQGDNFVVGRWLGAEALGFYGRAYQIATIPATLYGQAIDKVIFPSMSIIQNDEARLSSAFRRGTGLTALLVLPVSIITIILAPEIVNIFLGEAWVEATLPLQILAIGMFFRTGYKVSSTLIRAKGAVYKYAGMQIFYGISILLFTWFGHYYGIEGVASGVAFVLLMQYLIMSYIGLKFTDVSFYEFITLHHFGVLYCFIMGIIVFLVTLFCRIQDLPDVLTLLISITIPSILSLVLAVVKPNLLGKHGIWFIVRIIEISPVRLLSIIKYQIRLKRILSE